MTSDSTPKAGKQSGWTGFLAMAFGVVGLVSAIGIYGAQIPLERLAARNDSLTLFAQAPNDAAREAMRDALDDSAERLMTPGGHIDGDLPAKIAAERARLLPAFTAEARDIGFRLRCCIAGFTAAGALFGAMVLSIVGRRT
jgi:hypothetical protein